MSRILGYIIVAGWVAGPLEGQEIEQMRRRVDSTLREATIAQQAIREYRLAHPLRFDFSDSAATAGGKIRVYFDSGFAKQARAGLDEAATYISELGRALERTEPIIFSVAPDSLFNTYDQRYHRGRELNVRRHFAAYPNSPQRTSVDGDAQSIAYVFMRSISETVGAKAPSHLIGWANGTLPLAPRLDAKVDWGAMRLTIVSSPSYHGRACFLGNVKACRLMLGLDVVSDPVHQLFDSVGRQRRVSYDIDRARGFARVASERCLAGSDDACVAVLSGMGGINILTSPFIRSSLVTHALQLGGSRAPERLLMTPGTPGDALAAAAKLPLDSLVADWQRHLSDRSGASGNLPFTIAISSLLWISLCVFLALRSTRWR